MKLSLHIGLGKTGTTALQSFLKQEPDTLEQSRIRNTGVFLENLGGAFRLESLGAVRDAQILRKGLAEIEAAAAGLKDVDRIVWCNEALSMNINSVASARIIADFARTSSVFDKVEIILVLRRQDDWVEAGYRQWALKHKVYKGRYIKSPEEYLHGARRHLDYLGHYETWSQVGPGTVQVIPYDTVIDAGGVAPFFCRLWDIPWRDEFEKYRKVHKSLGPAKSRFVATFNRGFEREVLPREFVPLLQDYQLPDLGPEEAGFISRALRQEILTEYAAGNREVAERALGQPDLFPDRPVKDPTPYATGVEDSLTYLTLIAKRQHDRIGELTEMLENQRQEIERLKGRLS